MYDLSREGLNCGSVGAIVRKTSGKGIGIRIVVSGWRIYDWHYVLVAEILEIHHDIRCLYMDGLCRALMAVRGYEAQENISCGLKSEFRRPLSPFGLVRTHFWRTVNLLEISHIEDGNSF